MFVESSVKISRLAYLITVAVRIIMSGLWQFILQQDIGLALAHSTLVSQGTVPTRARCSQFEWDR